MRKKIRNFTLEVFSLKH